MGTVFLACEESGAHPLHREAILSGLAGHTALTQGFTGRLARGIDNELLQLLNKPGTEILPYPLQRFLMRSLALPAQEADRSDLLALWAGQSANLAHCPGIPELLHSLVQGAAEQLNRI
jgi:nitronate monooxygenase